VVDYFDGNFSLSFVLVLYCINPFAGFASAFPSGHKIIAVFYSNKIPPSLPLEKGGDTTLPSFSKKKLLFVIYN